MRLCQSTPTYSLDILIVLTINAVPDGTALIVAGFYGGDYSKPGIVGALLTPRQLREAVERLPLVDDGKRPEGSTSTVADVICGVILQMESGVRGKYFRELGKSSIGLLALASVFPKGPFVSYVRHNTFEEDGRPVTEATIQLGNWQELAWALHNNAPQTFYKVSEIVVTAKRSGTDLEEEFLRTAQQQFTKETTPVDDPFA